MSLKTEKDHMERRVHNPNSNCYKKRGKISKYLNSRVVNVVLYSIIKDTP